MWYPGQGGPGPPLRHQGTTEGLGESKALPGCSTVWALSTPDPVQGGRTPGCVLSAVKWNTSRFCD